MAFKADRVKLKPDNNGAGQPALPSPLAGEITITTLQSNTSTGGDYQLKLYDPNGTGTPVWKTVGPYTGGDGITLNSSTGNISIDIGGMPNLEINSSGQLQFQDDITVRGNLTVNGTTTTLNTTELTVDDKNIELASITGVLHGTVTDAFDSATGTASAAFEVNQTHAGQSPTSVVAGGGNLDPRTNSAANRANIKITYT